MITQHTPLGEVVAVLPGYALKGRVEPASDGRYQLIQGRHLTPGEPYRYAPEHRLRITPQRPAEPYRVRPGDVLLASRGNLNYAVALLAVPEPTIAPATFYILRPGPRVDPAYLAWVLEQPPVQAQMAQVRTTGAATPILQRADFKAVRIPLPPLARQACIAAVAALMGQERRLLRQLDAATARYHEAIGRALLAEPAD
ncbi:restriction endonuclease subunit S [uncultured Thiodictyon sp.]|uniref:restriction endonuclease subunit S n=1 Tax=uncultured Thiodictyon sp. TaxID=1846217 RepID=UPI0025F0C1E2|nr:restriction endonuclease subunit S [uncultured Thiodictyon sp.]